MPPFKVLGAGLLGAALAVLSAQPAQADREVRLRYVISLAGLTIGDAAFRYAVGVDDYQIDYTGRFSFLFWSADLDSGAAGSLRDDVLMPARYRLRVNSEETRQIVLDFNGDGTVERWSVDPPFDADEPEPEPRVPIDPASLVDVHDPLSALVVPDPDGRLSTDALCAQERRIFSGATRFDLVPDGAAPGDDGSVTCRFRYRPVSGHRVGSPAVDRAAETPLPVTLRYLADLGAWVPVRVSLPTRVGELVIARPEIRR